MAGAPKACGRVHSHYAASANDLPARADCFTGGADGDGSDSDDHSDGWSWPPQRLAAAEALTNSSATCDRWARWAAKQWHRTAKAFSLLIAYERLSGSAVFWL